MAEKAVLNLKNGVVPGEESGKTGLFRDVFHLDPTLPGKVPSLHIALTRPYLRFLSAFNSDN
jgi:hypothetical protein